MDRARSLTAEKWQECGCGTAIGVIELRVRPLDDETTSVDGSSSSSRSRLDLGMWTETPKGPDVLP